MSNIAIKVENLSKSYLVGHNAARAERYTALRDVIARNARDLARKTRDMLHGRAIVQGDEVEEFWVLKDINFEIQQGDRVGIIGRNGAGKSTLLKILSRITEPTTGRITLNGRVASLLEVGTGFHPELSGRENIFLNGAILGMSRKEIQRKFDEIVDFAEVEKFLDTPVKRYSSGMYVRLAFAVAAHLEPEILVVDEVLAVGDADFQKKCLGKMSEIATEGRTVLFVSHNMAAIRNLCIHGVYLEAGKSKYIGAVDEAISSYHKYRNNQKENQESVIRLSTTEYAKIISVNLMQFGRITDILMAKEFIRMIVQICVYYDLNWSFELVLRDQNNTPVAFYPGALIRTQSLPAGKYAGALSCDLDLSNLAQGKYSFDVILSEPGRRFLDYYERAVSFNLYRETEISGWSFRQERGQGSFMLNMDINYDS